jgi:hypothetical protein
MTFFEPVTDTLLICSGLSMHRLLEPVDGVLDRLLDVGFGLLAEPLAVVGTLGQQALALGLDLLAGRFEPRGSASSFWMKSGITFPRWWGPTMFAKRNTHDWTP